MGWFEDIFGPEDTDYNNNTKMAEKDLALDILKDSKFMLNTMSMAITETINPQLREILKRQLNEALQGHFRLADQAVQNDWYQPRNTPIDQINKDYQDVQTLTD